jgi:hypothetical protein
MASLAALALAATAAAPASATAAPASKPAFALSPVGTAGPLLLRGTPGRVLRGAVRVRNVTRHQVTVKLQAADIRNASNGNADYVTTRLSQTGRWLELAATTVQLAPGASQRVAFTVRVPATTRGASHYAGIVAVDAAELAAAAARKTTKGRTFSFRRINRQALPLTVRLPGPLTRNLALRAAEITVQPAGAGLVLGLLPGGSQLIQRARIKLRVLRGARTIFTHAATLGQLFPRAGLDYRIPWEGRPTEGSYRVLGVIRPHGAAAVNIDRTIQFSPAKAVQLEQETPPAARQPAPSMPLWAWLALAAAAVLLSALTLTVYKLARRPATPLA